MGYNVIHLIPLLQEMHTKSICTTSLQVKLYFHICELMNQCMAANTYPCFITGLEHSSSWFTMPGFYSHVRKCQTKDVLDPNSELKDSDTAILWRNRLFASEHNTALLKSIGLLFRFPKMTSFQSLGYVFLTSLSRHRWRYEACVGETISFLPQHGNITECHKTFILLSACLQLLKTYIFYFQTMSLEQNCQHGTDAVSYFCHSKYLYFDSMLGVVFFKLLLFKMSHN